MLNLLDSGHWFEECMINNNQLGCELISVNSFL